MHRAVRPIAAVLAATAIAGCAGPSAQSASEVAPTVSAPPLPRAGTVQMSAAQTESFAASFATWRRGFRGRARAAGISGAVFDAAFDGVGINDRVIELDRSQPEFSRPIWAYLDAAVSSTRVETGRRRATDLARTLGRIEAVHKTDQAIVLAIWGIESNFGSNRGSIPVIESLATLAYDGRRRAFAEEQLIAALKILAAGDVAPEAMKGSWAGAMGHTQFIPTSYLDYAVDFDQDGRRNVWADEPTDALASAAHYLERFGWRPGAPAAVEVRLPDGFDFAAANPAIRQSATGWQTLGVAAVGGSLPQGDDVAILVPAGARGPAFAVYPNFRVIQRYNNSTAYALAVSHLADRITGKGAIVQPWPRNDRTLSRTEKTELQERLTALGYSTGGADGIVGPNTLRAVRRFQSARGLVPDGYVSGDLLDAVRTASR